MSLIWWILPAISGVIGLMLLFAGFGKLASLKPVSGGGRLIFGVGFLGLAGIIALSAAGGDPIQLVLIFSYPQLVNASSLIFANEPISQ